MTEHATPSRPPAARQGVLAPQACRRLLEQLRAIPHELPRDAGQESRA